MVGITHLECQSLDDMNYVDAYAAQVREDKFNEKHSKIAEARGVLRNFFDRLKGIDSFQQFREGRDDLEAVVALVTHYWHVEEDNSRKSKLVRDDVYQIEQVIKGGMAANSVGFRWIVDKARHILNIDVVLEKEIVDGNIHLGTAAEIARIDKPAVRAEVIDYTKKEGLTKAKAAQVRWNFLQDRPRREYHRAILRPF